MSNQNEEKVALSVVMNDEEAKHDKDSTSDAKKIKYSINASYQSKLQVLDTIRNMISSREKVNFRQVAQACGFSATSKLYHSVVLRRLINNLREMTMGKADIERNLDMINQEIDKAEQEIKGRLEEGKPDHDADALSRCRRLQKQLTATEKEKAALLIQLGTLARENQILKEKLYSLGIYDDELSMDD